VTDRIRRGTRTPGKRGGPIDGYRHAAPPASSPIPRPYDLRHSFASLLLAEGRQPLYVARQLGHSLGVLLETYAHLIEEYAEAQRIDAEHEIDSARQQQMFGESSATTTTGSETA
jgi:integrase